VEPGKLKLTDKEVKKVMVGSIIAKRDSTPSEEEFAQILEEISYALVIVNVLELALQGEVLLEMKRGELSYQRVEDLPPDVRQVFEEEFRRIDEEAEGGGGNGKPESDGQGS
jgi:hypothetical protein